MILTSTSTTVAVGIVLLAGTEALPEPAAVKRQELSSSGEWSCGAGRPSDVFLDSLPLDSGCSECMLIA